VSLLTGKHTGHTSVRIWKHGLLVGDNEMTLDKLMKNAGYTTGQIGKWDCGLPPLWMIREETALITSLDILTHGTPIIFIPSFYTATVKR
jgi:hypothetical protein